MSDENKEGLDLEEIESSGEKIEEGVEQASAEGASEEAEGVDAASNEGADSGDIKSAKDLDALYDVPIQLQAVLGKSTMQVNQLLKLGRGAVVELDRKVGEAIDIYANDRLIARGEVVVVDDRLGITMTEIIKADHA